jgi:PAS domain S-box-containing protein
MEEFIGKNILEELSLSYAFNEIIKDKNGNAISYRFLEVSKSFEELTGLKASNLTGKDAREAIPGITQTGLDNLEFYIKVLRNGKKETTEKYSKSRDCWYQIIVIPKGDDKFHTILNNISSQKQRVLNDDGILDLSKKLLASGIEESDYNRLAEEICRLAGAKYSVLNLYSENRKNFTCVAVHGESFMVKTAYRLLGYALPSKEWDISAKRLKMIRGGKPVKFANIGALAEGVLPDMLTNAVSAALSIGCVYVVEISAYNSIVGDFILFFKKNAEIQNESTVSVFANMVGLALNKKKADEKIQISENNLNNFFNSGMDFHWVLDFKGSIITVNKTVLQRLGYTLEELKGQPVLAVHPVNQREKAQRTIEAMLKGEEKACNVPLMTKTGELIPVETYVISGTWNDNPALFGISKDITALKLSEEKFFKAFHKSPNIMGLSTIDSGIYVEVNNAFYEKLGFSPGEVIGKKSEDIIRFEGKFRETASKKLKETGSISNEETIVYTKHGEPLHILLFAEIIRTQEKEYNLTIAVDISEKQKAQEELFRAKELLDQTGRLARMGAWEVSVQDNKVYWSEIVKEIAGLPHDYPIDIDKAISFYKEGDNRERILELVSKAALEGVSFDEEFEMVLPSGEEIWIRNIVKPVYKDGVCIKLMGTTQDITSRKLAEETLKASEERHRTLFETLAQGIVYHDSNGIITDSNPAAARILGMSSEELKGLTIFNPIWNVYHEDHSIYLPEDYPVNRSFKTGKPVLDTVICLENLRDKKTRWILVNAIPEFKAREKKPFRVYSTITDITYRKEVENKLRESEQNYKNLQGLFRNMADIIPDMVWAKDLDKNFIFTNNSVCRNLINAKDTNEPIGKNDLFFMQRERESHPEDPEWHTFGENCRNSDDVVLESQETGQFDEYGNVKGKFLFLDVNKTPLRNSDGEMIGIVGTARDVTESKRAEQKLRESEANLKAIIENTLENIWSVNTSFEIQYVNEVFVKAFAATFGVELQIGSNIIEALPETLRVLWKERYNRALKNQHVTFEDRVDIGENSIYVEVSITPIIVDGIVVGLSAYGKDVTGKKLAEIELRYQADLRTLLSELSSGFINLPLRDIDSAIHQSLMRIGEFVGADRAYVYDYDFEHLRCNKTLEWIKQGAETGNKDFQSVSLNDLNYFVSSHLNGELVIINNISELEDKKLKKLLEKIRIRSILTIPLSGENGCFGFVGFDSTLKFHNYTDYEQQLLQTYAQTLVNVKERLEKEHKLIKAKDKAEESDRLKSAFLANMSHEIRTPMNGILGFLDLLKAPELSHESKTDYINIVTKSGQRLLNTIDDIIEISKIEVGELKVNLTPLNVNDLMQYFLNFFRPQALRKGLELKLALNVPGENVRLLTDRNKFESIVSNLLKNAIKFTEKGYIELGNYIKGESMVFYVSDTGIGIPKEGLDAIFNRFVQVDMSVSRSHEGTGLGLSIVKAYAQMLNGKIWVESILGEGSVFYFSLPNIIVSDYVQASIQKELIPEFTTQGIVVMVVEDDYPSYLYLDKILHQDGFRVIHKSNGEEAVQELRDNKSISLILMDIKMPGISGLDATKQIRQFNKTIPIIAQTSYALEGDREIAILAGCTDYIAKPINRDEIRKIVYKYTQKKGKSARS